MRNVFILLLMASVIGINPLAAQKAKPNQSTQKKGTTAKPPPKRPSATVPTTPSAKAGTIPATQIDTFKTQVTPLVNFFVSTMNFLASPKNPVNEKQTIITQSYLKFCWDSEVQVEDDLDDNRLVPLYKDMSAYLTDVSFFFKSARFTYTVQDINILANEQGATYFRVTANRNLKGININGDSVNSNKVRYIEINYDETKQQLKIVSVYTTKLNERDDMRNWWNGLSQGWKDVLAGGMMLEGTQPMAQIESFNDSLAVIGGVKSPIMGSEFYKYLNEIMHLTKVNLAGNSMISDLEPLGKISTLREVNISRTPVSDLMPLRNLNGLEVLDISGTGVTSLEPLRFCSRMQELRLSNTGVSDLAVTQSFPGLQVLDVSGTAITSLDAIGGLTSLRDLRLAHTRVSDLKSIEGLSALELLNIASTQVAALDPLKEMQKLVVLICDSTGVKRLGILDGLTAVKRVHADYCNIPQTEALNFLKKHPNASLVYRSAELGRWWKGLNAEWQNVFSLSLTLNNPPTSEQLHELVLLDSINIAGRASVTTLEPIRPLILLRVLLAQSTSVGDLSPLADLTELRTVNLSNTKVTDLAPFKQSPLLETLYFENTSVAELDPLFLLQNLKIIWADNSGVNLKEANDFFDKNPRAMLVFQSYENSRWWSALSQGWKDIMLDAASLKGTPDKVQLQLIANLNALTITENFQLNDLTPLLHLSRLSNLQFSGTSVSSLAPLTRMPQLKVLRCSKNPISDLTPLTGLPNLRELDVSNTQVEELLPLQNMMQLEVLKFSGTPVKNLKYIAKLVNLQILEFYNTRVSNIDPLAGMTKLETLKLFSTKVSERKVQAFRQAHPKCEVVFY